MISRSFRFALSIAFAFTISCSTDTPTGSVKAPVYTVDQLLAFNHSEIIRVKSPSAYLDALVEPFLQTEKIIGEPFTDVNENGVYDESIDGFIISVDPIKNQDLDHNGKYDGPDSYWYPGSPIPFDDIDGNGIPRTQEHPWQPGVPFCDYNQNGIWDSAPFWSFFALWGISAQDSAGTHLGLYFVDSMFTFTSDSNVTYVLSPGVFCLPCDSLFWSFEFVVNGSSCRLQSENPPFDLPVFSRDTVSAGPSTDSAHFGALSFECRKTISFDKIFNFVSIADSHLVCVRIDSLKSGDSYRDYVYKDCYSEMYFSLEKGPVGFTVKYDPSAPAMSYHFGQRMPARPIPMIR